MSMYTAVYGIFYFNKTPLAPLGMNIIIHEKPDQRASCNAHSINGWYLIKSKENYWFCKLYAKKMREEQICDTVKFPPTKVPIPFLSLVDKSDKAALKLRVVLKNYFQPTRFAHIVTSKL